MKTILRFVVCSAAILSAGRLLAAPVGERHLVTTDATAALRDSQHRPLLRVTVWYPAAEGADERRIDIGPPNEPLFQVGATASDAPFADAQPRAVVLLSHGFGGSARMMAWFGMDLARHGYVVIAVDHPGNNGIDPMTVAGAILTWDRAQDLQAALDAAGADAKIGPHLDLERLGVAGFSAGGFTALISAGARVDIGRLQVFCREDPDDGVCAPQKEFAVTQQEARRALQSPELAAEVAHAVDDHRIGGVRAVFAMAPAIVQSLEPASLSDMEVPVAIVLGDADQVAPPRTNGLVAAHDIPHATLRVLPGVGHYDFLSTCTPAGIASVPLCKMSVPQQSTHEVALALALNFFDLALRRP